MSECLGTDESLIADLVDGRCGVPLLQCLLVFGCPGVVLVRLLPVCVAREKGMRKIPLVLIYQSFQKL